MASLKISEPENLGVEDQYQILFICLLSTRINPFIRDSINMCYLSKMTQPIINIIHQCVPST